MTGHREPPEDSEAATTIAEQDMRDLVEGADAEPLLPDTFPIPARYGGRWWHQPLDAAATDFRPVAAEQAARYEALLRRRRQARAAAERPPSGRAPDG